jgi:hypothetical protein
MKTRFLATAVVMVLGFLQISESFSEDSIPSCSIGVFVSYNIECHTTDAPPCPEPALEKSGFCVVEKNEICGKGNILNNGLCIPDTGQFRIDDPDFVPHYMITNQPMANSGPSDFRKSDDSGSLLYAYSGFVLVGSVVALCY